MYIKQIKDFDQYSNEADIIVTDGQYELMCYCHPADVYDSKAKVSEIIALFAQDIIRIDSEDSKIIKLKDYYSYQLQGKIVNKNVPIVCIGELTIKLDTSTPKDLKEGEYIQFNVERLDCIVK